MGVSRVLSAVAAGGLMVCTAGASPASAGTPATVTVRQIVDAGFIPCGTTMLSFTGTERVIERVGESASGNQTLTFVVTSNGVVTDEAGNVFRIHGAQILHNVIQIRDGVETYQQTFNDKFVILDPDGGLANKFNVTFNGSFSIDEDGVLTESRYHLINQGTC